MIGIEGLLATHGIWAILILVALEYVGIPLPTELAYVAAGGIIAKGILPYWVVFSCIMAAHMVGATFSYTIGRRAALLARQTEFSHVQQRLMRWYKTYGPVAILATQLVGHIRPWASYIAGFAQIKRTTFYSYNFIGSAALTALMLFLADKLVTIWNAYPWLRVVLVAIFVAVIVAAVFSLLKKLASWHKRRTLRLSTTKQQPVQSQQTKAKRRTKRAA
jgi:membrane protein DedA with SNARE-associated domain